MRKPGISLTLRVEKFGPSKLAPTNNQIRKEEQMFTAISFIHALSLSGESSWRYIRIGCVCRILVLLASLLGLPGISEYSNNFPFRTGESILTSPRVN